MARGWDSKSVEAQIEETAENRSNNKQPNYRSAEEVHNQIRKANLRLSRKRILQQLESSSNERYSELLRRSLAELDGQLAAD